jgi:hypothetical protein
MQARDENAISFAKEAQDDKKKISRVATRTSCPMGIALLNPDIFFSSSNVGAKHSENFAFPLPTYLYRKASPLPANFAGFAEDASERLKHKIAKEAQDDRLRQVEQPCRGSQGRMKI